MLQRVIPGQIMNYVKKDVASLTVVSRALNSSEHIEVRKGSYIVLPDV